jgi:murein DD-endopeptidase MepM/ murein hydrolase activator NlpD
MKIVISVSLILSLFFSGGLFYTNDISSSKLNNKNALEINQLLSTDLSNGFDYPVGDENGKGKYTSKTDGKTYDSWYISTQFLEDYSLGIHPGIDINGTGGGNTDEGQPVFSIAQGIVEDATDYDSPWGNVVILKHSYLENGNIMYCYSVYAHLINLRIKKGDVIKHRQKIGEIGTGGGCYYAHLHLEIRKENMFEYQPTYWPSSNSKDKKWIAVHYENPVEFINKHRTLTKPSTESSILIAIKHKYKMYHCANGKIVKNYDIALSQVPWGHKEEQGDNKMPEGEYFICQKQKGPFQGNFSEFLGPCLLRVSYPNSFDAETGLKKRFITKSEYKQIISAINSKKTPPKNTRLGGGIVIHGWNGDWIADGTQNLTWGCISMHNHELEQIYPIIPVGTKIIIQK